MVFNVYNTWGVCTQNATADHFSMSVRFLEAATCNGDSPCDDVLICEGKANSGHLKLPKQKIRSIGESLSLGTEGSVSYYLHTHPPDWLS